MKTNSTNVRKNSVMWSHVLTKNAHKKPIIKHVYGKKNIDAHTNKANKQMFLVITDKCKTPPQALLHHLQFAFCAHFFACVCACVQYCQHTQHISTQNIIKHVTHMHVNKFCG